MLTVKKTRAHTYTHTNILTTERQREKLLFHTLIHTSTRTERDSQLSADIRLNSHSHSHESFNLERTKHMLKSKNQKQYRKTTFS